MVHAIILAGGWGRRLWPKSRRSLPKQILRLGNNPATIDVLMKSIKPLIPPERTWLVTNQTYAQSLRRHLPDLPGKNFLVEPLPKNTAAAIGWACLAIKRVDPDALTVILPSDNLLGQKTGFLRALKTGLKKAQQTDALVTIGIKPSRPAPEFGYIKVGLGLSGQGVCKVEKFIEKPEYKKAKAYSKSKYYFWNGGIFIWQVGNFFKAVKKYCPDLYSGLQRIEGSWDGRGYRQRLLREYRNFKDISIDYALMEKADNVYVVLGGFSWRDLGSWLSLSAQLPGTDKQGNVVYGLAKSIDTYNSLIFSENKHLIATLGLRDLIIVHTPSATLVCRKDNSQDVKKLTELLEQDSVLKNYL